MKHLPKSLLKLPQRQESWYLAVRKLRVWITPPDEAPSRPYGVFAVSLDQGYIQGFEIVPLHPSTDQIIEALSKFMSNQSQGVPNKPHRPMEIHFEDDTLRKTLSPLLEEIGVLAVFEPYEELADEIVWEMGAEMMGGSASIPGLLSVEGVTPELVGSIFAAAADFYRAEPWVHLTNLQPLSIQVEPETRPRYAVIMGNGGVEYGIALYNQWDDFMCQFDLVDHPMETMPEAGAHSIFYDGITKIPLDDLDALEAHGWEFVDQETYPIPIIFTKSEEIRRPDRAELEWYQAAMRAIMEFVPSHLESDGQGDYLPAKAEFDVAAHDGMKKVTVEYPAGDVPVENRPAEMLDWADPDDDDDYGFDMPMGFDRRAMEGSLPRFESVFKDPKDQQAQDLMYTAWDEKNPAKRINLAHQALDISPNCADAYVLLAEEAADTLGRAQKYYHLGVKAGEKALGEEFFDENEGYFWGILETRPYMRARAGLANVLWDSGKREEAATHYREMLRLNPNDNQGNRYSLLILLLELSRFDQVDALLDEYEGDWSSEWLYTRVLRLFQEEGDSSATRQALQEALEQNPHVPDFLTGAKRIPNRLPGMISLGRESEAVHYTSAHLNFWRRTHGAILWLKTETQPTGQKRRGRPKQKPRGGKGRKK